MARCGLAMMLAVAMTGVHDALEINGWYNCSIDTFQGELPMLDNLTAISSSPEGGDSDAILNITAISKLPMAQCALIQAPLCHKDVCANNDKSIELFVKRVLATSASPSMAPDVWFIQGGPGASSEGMESAMQDMLNATKGNVNVYTVDHRGTGRSNRFDCVAAQSTTSGSPEGQSVTPEEFAGCSADLAKEYGDDLSAFSVTSAASDIAWLVKGLKSAGGVFVYGVSYGTAVVERLIHLNATEIAGYILDGVATSSGAGAVDKFEYFSTWDVDFGLAGDRFLEVCKNDTFCGGKFGSKGPAQTLKDLYAHIDSSEEASACTGLPEVLRLVSEDPVSFAVRKHFGGLLQSERSRLLIPVLIYRMNRCSNDDKRVLENYFNSSLAMMDMPDESASYQSNLLYELITYSEMWENPQPHNSEMLARFTSQLITNGETYTSLPNSCLYLMDKSSPACQELNITWDELPSDTRPIAYKHDKHWNTSAVIADNASLLILNGKLDPQTHYRYAEYLYESIIGKPEEQKKLLLFEYLPHGTIFIPDEEGELPCALRILASYVGNAGKLSSIDTSCMQKQKPVNFTIDPSHSELYFGTSEAYNGKLEAESNVEPSKNHEKTYKALMIVFICLFVVTLAIAGYLFHRLRSLQQKTSKLETGEATFVQVNAD